MLKARTDGSMPIRLLPNERAVGAAPVPRPTGTVTFLFTDIEGSTRLWERYSAEMPAAFQRQEAILRQAIADHEGYAYKMIGDAFQAAFATAPAALAAALAAQRSLAAEDWGPIEPLRVRMALDAGVVEERGDDYVGPLLNRTARLLAAGHGGQILLSAAAHELVSGQLPHGAALRDLGIHRLKDLTRPEPIFQVVVPDLPADFPLLRTAAPPTPDLPVPPTPFIGRAMELDEIAALLDDPACRLLTLAGPGGIGKTRLALESARQQSAAYQHGAYFVDLAPLSSAAPIVSAIADALRLPSHGAGDPREALLSYLREKHLLLLLDNFEHVLPGAALLGDILAEAPRIKLLVTSRERLCLRAERVYDVGGLVFPGRVEQPDFEVFDAVQMFVAYARHTYARYQLEEADKPAVMRICQLADGMPLGIELAAAWARMLPAAAIAGQIEASLDFLATTMRDVPPRHNSMRAVFTHSWSLLSEEEQAVFERLSVFRGGFTRQAAQHVAAAAIGPLARLIDKSLLHADSDGRYALHELLRQFAEEELSAHAEQETLARDRHSDFFLSFLASKEPDLKGARQTTALAEIEHEFENIRSAWLWAIRRGCWQNLRRSMVAFSFFIDIRSRQQEGLDLYQRIVDATGASGRALEELEPEPALTAAIALTKQAFILSRLGRIDAINDCLERGRATVLRFGSPYDIGTHNHYYALACIADPEEARSLFEQAQSLFQAMGAQWELGFALSGMGMHAFGRGMNDEARRLFREALTNWRETGMPISIAAALHNLGLVAFALGQYEEAARLQRESLALRQASNQGLTIAQCQESMGDIACVQAQLEAAEGYYDEALALYRDLGHSTHQSRLLSKLGGAVLTQGQLARTAELLAEALAIAERNADQRGIARVHAQLGYLAFEQRALATATQHWRTCLDIGLRVRDRQQILVTLDALIGLSALMVEAGDPEQAVELLTLIRRAASIDRHTQTRAERTLADIEASLAPGRFAAAQARGRLLELDAAVAGALATH
jgi:predicted ATPase/class 3 adenylate cyclase